MSEMHWNNTNNNKAALAVSEMFWTLNAHRNSLWKCKQMVSHLNPGNINVMECVWKKGDFILSWAGGLRVMAEVQKPQGL